MHRECGARADALARVQHLLVDVGRLRLPAKGAMRERGQKRAGERQEEGYRLPKHCAHEFRSKFLYCTLTPVFATPSVSSCLAVRGILRILFTSALMRSTAGFGRFF